MILDLYAALAIPAGFFGLVLLIDWLGDRW